MVERDYIMRLIREMVRAILKLFFNIDSESPYDLNVWIGEYGRCIFI